MRTFEAYTTRAERDRKERMSLAWHVALLGRVDPKKFPTHDKFVQPGRSKRRPMTEEEQWRVMSAMARKG